jgi:hypothetical protein
LRRQTSAAEPEGRSQTPILKAEAPEVFEVDVAEKLAGVVVQKNKRG